MCFDCLVDLPNCQSCSAENICDQCTEGFYIDQFTDDSVRQTLKTGCLSCEQKHGELSLNCDKQESFKCGGKVTSLVEGQCVNCL